MTIASKFLIIPLDPYVSYLDRVKAEEAREHKRYIEWLKRTLEWYDKMYCGSDSAFWDMVCDAAGAFDG